MVKGHAAVATLMLVVSLALFVPPAAAAFSSLAASGHDAVAAFTGAGPVAGSSRYETRWNGATWRFARAGNPARFRADGNWPKVLEWAVDIRFGIHRAVAEGPPGTGGM